MTRTVAICTLLAWGAVWVCLVAAAPAALSDRNDFLKDFVGSEFLNFMGVVVTITLASCANLYIEMNKIEDKHDKTVFRRAKASVRNSAYWLVALLVVAILIVIIKPLLGTADRMQAGANGAAIAVLIFSVLTLIDLTVAGFSLDPRADD